MKNLFSPRKKAIGKVLALFIFCFAFSSETFGQTNTLSTDSLSIPSTGVLNNTTTAFVRVKNLDTIVYNGSLNIHYSTDSGGFTVFHMDTIPSVTILAQGTFTFSSTLSLTSPDFNVGSNIVVVWSSGNGKMAADTTSDTITITPDGIHDNYLNHSFTVFPNPAGYFLSIKATDTKGLELVRIKDVFGRTLYSETFRSESVYQKIDIRQLPAGLYFLELLYSGQRRGVQKFVRSD